MGKPAKPHVAATKQYACVVCGRKANGVELQVAPGSRRGDPQAEQPPPGWFALHRADQYDCGGVDYACSERCARVDGGERGPVMSTKPVRVLGVSLTQILDVALLTYEEGGTTGALVREGLFEMVGRSISDEEIRQYVDHKLDAPLAEHLARRGMTLEAWIERWERETGRSWKKAAEDERAYLLKRVTETVAWMRERS